MMNFFHCYFPLYSVLWELFPFYKLFRIYVLGKFFHCYPSLSNQTEIFLSLIIPLLKVFLLTHAWMISFLHCYFIPLCTKSVGVISLLQTVIIHARLSPPVNLHFTVFDKVVSPYSQGCQAGSILHRLSWLLAAATRVLTRLSAPSKVARSEILQSEVKINNSEFPKAKNCRFFLSLTCPTSFFNLMSIRGKNILSQKNVSPT